MSSAELAGGMPHKCLAALISPLPGGGYVAQSGPASWPRNDAEWLNGVGILADSPGWLRGCTVDIPLQWADPELERMGHLFLTGMTAAEMVKRGPMFLPTEPGTQVTWRARWPRRSLAARILAWLRSVARS